MKIVDRFLIFLIRNWRTIKCYITQLYYPKIKKFFICIYNNLIKLLEPFNIILLKLLKEISIILLKLLEGSVELVNYILLKIENLIKEILNNTYSFIIIIYLYVFIYLIFYSNFIKTIPLMWHEMSIYNNMNEHLHMIIVIVLYYFVLVPIFVIFFDILLFSNQIYIKNFFSFQKLEFAWVLYPAIILLIIAFPSIFCLYELDNVINSLTSLKILGNQWYWQYQFTKINKTIDSYNISLNDLSFGDIRLREVNDGIILPSKSNIKILLSSNDVIHSFFIATIVSKIDAIPGRINQAMINIKSVFNSAKGACAEICGIFHNNMSSNFNIINTQSFINLIN